LEVIVSKNAHDLYLFISLQMLYHISLVVLNKPPSMSYLLLYQR